MTNREFSDAFSTLLNSHNHVAGFGSQSSVADIALDEYEKSLYLTEAQEEVFVNLYNGNNPYNIHFEGTEEARRYLSNLVKTATLTTENDNLSSTKSRKSPEFKLPDDLAFITMEEVVYDSEDTCVNGTRARVYPITQDEYGVIRDNPFRGATKYKALRMDIGSGRVRIMSAYYVREYDVTYLRKPRPIILEDLSDTQVSIDGKTDETECEMNALLHRTILERAVALALQSKSIGFKANNMSN